MKKQILNIGKVLNRAEQKQVFGGNMTLVDAGDYVGCLSAGAYCRTDVTNEDLQCCGSCKKTSDAGRNGLCKD
ncbi:hypothetical protein [Polaribacter sp. IC073]|uniref:hypothetical protein n=1 Tax=Polaribacter sp. IC073 TaxID=2508540 RepID=UPI0011BF2191|nr:hypothetical protein [Polaribacter sp. IC073]TXD50049.1 hypothetical protein ES045_02395 [Polaribacter sp. IC073]